MSELITAVLSFTAGLFISWKAAGNYYRQLISQLIDRNRQTVAEMRQEAESQRATSPSNAA